MPDVHGRRRAALLRTLRRPRLASPARAVPWLEVRASYDRALRARGARARGRHRGAPRRSWCCTPTRRRWPTCAPRRWRRSRACGPATAEKLADTLRAWLLLQGRRDDVAAALFVHPQTVRYRMGQLRELYGDRLDDPDVVLELLIALA